MFNQQDQELLLKKGISEEKVQQQLRAFRQGFPYLKLKGSASPQHGILVIGDSAASDFIANWTQYLQDNKRILKFVPASGAASRMFKDLFEFLDSEKQEPVTDFEKKFFAHLHDFAFYADLNASALKNQGKTLDELIEAKRYKSIVSELLGEQGLNYGNLPKGLLKFHNYPEDPRTAMEEHLVEGALYAANGIGEVNLHFTVSPEHRALFEALALARKSHFEKRFGVTYHITFSVQKSSTDTIAADSENNPFRDNGKLLFRPGGHGALIENLNEIDADVLFIKNIDNVVPDRLKEPTVRYKQILGGVLVSLQKQIFHYLEVLEQGTYTEETLDEMLAFLENSLYVENPTPAYADGEEKANYIRTKLQRPLRVCGMVKNVGEPGGGPFLAFNADGTVSPQILESSQIDMNDAGAKASFEGSTHFNPVDLVCATKDKAGNAYDLLKFVDPQTGFISLKSKNGKELKALELPGLWNGAMSDWNTVFVEVPVETFNPVKTVNDLLRDQHQ